MQVDKGVPCRISVIIAAYNAADTLGAQLDALASQHALRDVAWEVLVCDNGSTDGTRNVVGHYRERIPGLRIVDASGRRGPAHARNCGAKFARGEFLAFCDADDVVALDWLNQLNRAFDEHDFLAGSFESTLLNDAKVLRSRQLSQADGLQHTASHSLPHAGAGNMGIRRATFLRLGGFDENILRLEDTDLSWRVQQDGTPLAFVPEVVAHVRLRSSWRGMFTQGRGYGSAHHALERRYPADRPASGPVERHPRRRTRLPRLPRNVGRAVWRLGWTSGNRLPQKWARAHIPLPQPLKPVTPGPEEGPLVDLRADASRTGAGELH